MCGFPNLSPSSDELGAFSRQYRCRYISGRFSARYLCGPDAYGIVEGVRQFVEAGFEQAALVQIGARQEELCEFYERESGESLRQL